MGSSRCAPVSVVIALRGLSGCTLTVLALTGGPLALGALSGWAVSGCASRAPAAVVVPGLAPGGLTVVGSYVMPAARDMPDELSGAWFDRASGELFVVSDAGLPEGLMVMDLTVEPDVRIAPRAVRVVDGPVAGRELDLEGIAPGPSGHLFVSSEGEEVSPGRAVPGIFEITREGRFVRRLLLPAAWAGLRLNLGLEALSASPDGRWLFAASEGALGQDGGAATAGAGALCRIVAYDLRAGRAPREYAYRTEPVPRLSDRPTVGEIGVSEVLALSADQLLVLERAYVQEAGPGGRSGNTIRLYRVRLETAAEVTGRWSLTAEAPTAVLQKTLVLDLASVASQLAERLRGLENFEAMTFGPVLADGRQTLVLVSDNNGGRNQVTGVVVLAFAADPRVAPAAGRRMLSSPEAHAP